MPRRRREREGRPAHWMVAAVLRCRTGCGFLLYGQPADAPERNKDRASWGSDALKRAVSVSSLCNVASSGGLFRPAPSTAAAKILVQRSALFDGAVARHDCCRLARLVIGRAAKLIAGNAQDGDQLVRGCLETERRPFDGDLEPIPRKPPNSTTAASTAPFGSRRSTILPTLGSLLVRTSMPRTLLASLS